MKNYTYYFIYKTVCIVNNKFYIGKHCTNDINDNYLGSGLILKRSIKKYGKENHIREILEFLPNRKSLNIREIEIVNKDILNDPLCMNLATGGEGGLIFLKIDNSYVSSWDLARKSSLHVYHNKMKNDLIFRNSVLSKMSNARTQAWKDGKYIRNHTAFFKGKNHTDEAKAKISKSSSSRTGDLSSRTNTVWITNGIDTLSIKKDNIEEYLNNGWKKGRTYSEQTKINIKKGRNKLGKRIWMNNGSISKQILESEIDKYSSWNIGRIKLIKTSSD